MKPVRVIVQWQGHGSPAEVQALNYVHAHLLRCVANYGGGGEVLLIPPGAPSHPEDQFDGLVVTWPHNLWVAEWFISTALLEVQDHEHAVICPWSQLVVLGWLNTQRVYEGAYPEAFWDGQGPTATAHEESDAQALIYSSELDPHELAYQAGSPYQITHGVGVVLCERKAA